MSQKKGVCPLCSKSFPVSSLEAHVNSCMDEPGAAGGHQEPLPPPIKEVIAEQRIESIPDYKPSNKVPQKFEADFNQISRGFDQLMLKAKTDFDVEGSPNGSVPKDELLRLMDRLGAEHAKSMEKLDQAYSWFQLQFAEALKNDLQEYKDQLSAHQYTLEKQVSSDKRKYREELDKVVTQAAVEQMSEDEKLARQIAKDQAKLSDELLKKRMEVEKKLQEEPANKPKDPGLFVPLSEAKN
eukprot:TRINITY_DN6685_c0_g1_i1.p1 TRINITY_DN6685_c0_g1~~TRINITY_DN6685_c0_g1_i1.p1  ORF type:complete len:240 (-),score=64.65 TRINITY_DN6685_c0_g1_i1:24-743(-)